MDLFEQLFAEAERIGLIEKNKVSYELDYYRKEQSLKRLREYDITMFNIGFREWLANQNNQTELNDIEYSEILKGKNAYNLFVDFIHYRKAEVKKNIIENVEKTSKDNRYSEKQLIAMEILGLATGENNYNPVQPVFHHIDDVLTKHNLTNYQALILLKKHTGGLNTAINKSLTEEVIKHLECLVNYENLTPPKQTKTKTEQEQPKTFDELFYNPEHAEPCLQILSKLQPPVIDAINNYIGKGKKGVFPLWVDVLKNHKPKPLIKHFKDSVYTDLLNQKVKGLNLTKDASEFRKVYKRLETNKIELDIKVILSQYSQSGKLGK